jgi:hypothetical protein
MLLTKSIIIKMNRGNLGYYNKVMQNKYRIGEEVDVPVHLLPKSVYYIVLVCCDICKEENNVTYRNYNDCLGYGFYSCNNCKHIKRKITCEEKYGYEDFINFDKIKNTKFERYGNEKFNNRDKCKITCLDKYGVDNVSKSEHIKEKRIKTNLKNWGVLNVFQSEFIKNKNKEIHLLNLGVEHPSKSTVVKEKKIDTCNSNFGVDYPTQSVKVLNKIKLTNNKNYGKDWYLSTNDFKLKSKKTNNERYGFDYPMQNFTIFNKQQKSGFKSNNYNGVTYRGTYELDFLKFCENKELVVENGPSIKYLYKDKYKVYHSDFFIPKYNLICEVKSSYYYYKYLELNNIKERETKNQGYNFIFIIDKDYSTLDSLI